MGALFEPRTLLLGLVTFLSVRLVRTLLVSWIIGSYPLASMLRVLLRMWLLRLMSGLMGAWWRMKSLVLVRQVRASSRIVLVFSGRIVGGAIWMMTWVETCQLGLAVVFVLCLVLCSLSKELIFFWRGGERVIHALQAADGVLGVVRHIGRLLDDNVGSSLAELVKDGDLILLVGRMLRIRGLSTVRIAKVKGHADEGMVRDGGVREQDRVGNNAADEAAHFGATKG